jgi:hypothetical protein
VNAEEEPGKDARSDRQHQRRQQRHFAERASDIEPELSLGPRSRRGMVRRRREHREQDQRQDRVQVFDDQPSDRDLSRRRLVQAASPQHPEQHDGACNRDGEPEDRGGSERPSEREPGCEPQRRSDGDLRDGAGNGDAIHSTQVPHAEMETHTEHQEGDADLGELEGDVGVGDEPRRERPDGDPGGQISDDRGHPEQLGEEAADERRTEADRHGGDERCAVSLHGPLARSRTGTDRRGHSLRAGARSNDGGLTS